MDIYINNVKLNSEIVNSSLSISLKTNGERSCSVSFYDVLPSVKDGDELEVFDGVTKLFGGIIKSYSVEYYSPITDEYPIIKTSISSDGYNYITSRRVVNVNVNNKTAGSIVTDMWEFLSQETIYKGTIQTGPTLDYVAKYKTIKQVLDDMAKASGKIWYIDNARTLQFVRPTDTVSSAPYQLKLNGTFTDFSDLKWSGSIENYYNKVFVLGANTIQMQKQSDAEIAQRSLEAGGSGTGIYGYVISEDTIKSTVQAEEVADNFLIRSAVRPGKLSFTTYTNGFLPGMKLSVQIPQITGYIQYPVNLGINIWYYMIDEVSIDLEPGGILRYDISATRRHNTNFTTQRSPGFEDYFKEMSKFWF